MWAGMKCLGTKKDKIRTMDNDKNANEKGVKNDFTFPMKTI